MLHINSTVLLAKKNMVVFFIWSFATVVAMTSAEIPKDGVGRPEFHSTVFILG